MDKKVRVLITEAGGPAAVGMIKSFRDASKDVKIIAVDCNELSAGLYLADKHYIVSPYNREWGATSKSKEKFKQEIKKIIQSEKINLIVPTGENDLIFFAENGELLNKSLCVVMSNPETITICKDKL